MIRRILRALKPGPSLVGVFVVGVIMIFVAGAALGASAAEAGEEKPDVVGHLVEESISDGEVVKPDNEFSDEIRKPTGYDWLMSSQTIRQLLVPTMKFASHIAAVGSSLGFWSVNVLGETATQGWMLTGAAATVGIAGYSIKLEVTDR